METQSDDAVLLTTYSDTMQAGIAKQQLEEAGVDVELSDEDVVDAHPLIGSAAGGVKLWVPESEAERAEKALEDATDASDPLELDEDQLMDLDDENQLPETILTCPECGSKDVGFSNAFAVFWAIVVLTVALPAIPAVSMTIGFAVTGTLTLIGIVLMALRVFPLRCKDCGTRGKRARFEDNPRVEVQPAA